MTPRGFLMPLTKIAVDDGPHNMDGLLLHAWDGSERVEAFISRRVMESWVDPRGPYESRRSLFRGQYNALGKLNLAAIERRLLPPNTSAVRLSTASIPSSMFCCQISRKAGRCSM